MTEFSPDQKASYTTRKDNPWQHHFNRGIAAAFLTKLHMATGESVWLDRARRYQEFSMTTGLCQFESMQVCKSRWASGLLHAVTREARYGQWTRRLGNWFAEYQHIDGH